jgi:iron complex outermembrane receptor protein
MNQNECSRSPEYAESVLFAANGGFSLFGRGFINLTFESTDNDALSRGEQRPDAQALIDAGVQGVGADSPFDDAPLAQTWGRPETKANRFFVNAGFDISESMELYGFAGYSDTEGRYRFFYRNPSHSTLNGGSDPLNVTPTVTSLPAGYTPFLDGDQKDYTFVTGLRGDFFDDIQYDFSFGYGKNELDYFLNNTVNPSAIVSATDPGQRGFDMGGYEQEEINFNADFSQALSTTLNLAYGFEWREETYTTVAGEPNSIADPINGPSGMTSVSPAEAGDFDRDNYALYVDFEQDISDDWLMQYALRYEDFSDFGSTVNWKLATRYKATDTITFRGAISTGFHAPTPGQANVSTTITTFDGASGLQVEESLVPATSPEAVAVGGKELKEEESFNFSVGFVADISDNTTLTMDYYLIEVDDRIYRTGDIDASGDITDPDTSTISFYTNALNVKHRGIDLVLTSNVDWSNNVATDVSFAFSYNQIDVTDQKAVNTPTGSFIPVSDSQVEDIENNYPNQRFVLTANTHFGPQWNLMLRANYYGKHYDERNTIAGTPGTLDLGPPVEIVGYKAPSAQIDDIIYIDIELGYEITENWKATLGGSNIFDKYVDKLDDPFANRNSVGLPYPRRTAANYEGASYYGRIAYTW